VLPAVRRLAWFVLVGLWRRLGVRLCPGRSRFGCLLVVLTVASLGLSALLTTRLGFLSCGRLLVYLFVPGCGLSVRVAIGIGTRATVFAGRLASRRPLVALLVALLVRPTLTLFVGGSSPL
jgi:hypothetical protein